VEQKAAEEKAAQEDPTQPKDKKQTDLQAKDQQAKEPRRSASSHPDNETSNAKLESNPGVAEPAQMVPVSSTTNAGRGLVISNPMTGRTGLGGIRGAPQTGGDGYRSGVFDVYLMVEYRHEETKFTGRLTPTLVSPSPVPPFFPPDQPIAFVPGAFEPNTDQLTSYASIRFKDFGFEKLRFSSQASFRYWGDLDGTTEASPFLSQLDAFTGRRVLEPLTAFADARGFVSEENQTKFNLRVGRQYVYGAESVRLDGALLTINHPRFNFDVFGGRRTTFFSDPRERGVVGTNFQFFATPSTTLTYEYLHYVENSHRFQVAHRLNETWALNGNFFLLNTSPIDLNVDAFWMPGDGKTRVIFSFLQKLTSEDFIYDYTYRAQASNPENQIFLKLFPIPPTGIPLDGAGRLNLLEVNPYTQFYVDGYRYLTQKIGVGGSFWLRQVNDSDDAGPFDTSFQELRVNGDWFPSSLFEVGGEYRFRNISRDDPNEATEFPDIRREGETKFHEIYGNSAVHLLDNRLTVEGGVFYRRFNTQSRLVSFKGLDTLGWTAGVRWRINRNYGLLVEYGRDNDFEPLNPDIDYSQAFRVRFDWRFSR
jgi:hypothetical protein